MRVCVCVNGDNIHVYCGGPLWEKCVTVEFEGLLQGICSLIYTCFLISPPTHISSTRFSFLQGIYIFFFKFSIFFFGSCRLIWNSSLTISWRSYSVTVSIFFFKSVVCEVGFCFLDQFLAELFSFFSLLTWKKCWELLRGRDGESVYGESWREDL